MCLFIRVEIFDQEFLLDNLFQNAHNGTPVCRCHNLLNIQNKLYIYIYIYRYSL